MNNEYPICSHYSQPLNIKLGPFARDERTRFVEQTLDLLLESRFGPYRVLEAIAEFIEPSRPDDDVLYDLTPVGLFEYLSLQILRGHNIDAVAPRIAETHFKPLAAVGGFAPSSKPPATTLARGSPAAAAHVS